MSTISSGARTYLKADGGRRGDSTKEGVAKHRQRMHNGNTVRTDADELPRAAYNDERPAPRQHKHKTRQLVGGTQTTISLSQTPPRFFAHSHLYRLRVAHTSPYFPGCTPGVRSRMHPPRPTSAPHQPGSSSSMSQWTPGPPSTYPHSSAPPALDGRWRREVVLKEAAGGRWGEKQGSANEKQSTRGRAGTRQQPRQNKERQQHAELRQSCPEQLGQ